MQIHGYVRDEGGPIVTFEAPNAGTGAFQASALGRGKETDVALGESKRTCEERYPVEVAEIYAFRGETDRAFAELDAALRTGDPELMSITSDSDLKPLVADRRYRALLRKLHLPLPPA